jgi:hypothetical protein
MNNASLKLFASAFVCLAFAWVAKAEKTREIAEAENTQEIAEKTRKIAEKTHEIAKLKVTQGLLEIRAKMATTEVEHLRKICGGEHHMACKACHCYSISVLLRTNEMCDTTCQKCANLYNH